LAELSLSVFRAARVARTLTAKFGPIAGRRVLSLKEWLLPYSRVCKVVKEFAHGGHHAMDCW